jgi:ATP-binding cassette subfamily C (CFTR/MRP) protein 1
VPAIAAVLAFVVYGVTGNKLNPADIFTSLSLFNLLRSPLMLLPRSLSAIVDGKNAIGRVSEVFLASSLDLELPRYPYLSDALVVAEASFEWEASRSEGQTKGRSHKGDLPHVKDKLGKGPKRCSQELGKESKNDSKKSFALKNVNLRIPREGTVHAIVGPIGSGKSSLLSGRLYPFARALASTS